MYIPTKNVSAVRHLILLPMRAVRAQKLICYLPWAMMS
jgi:hypothetical protein